MERPELHLEEDAARTRTFVLSSHGKAVAMAPAVLPLLDIAGRRQLLDVGGGPGTFSVCIARAHPEIRCTVLELPPIAAIAAGLIETIRDLLSRADASLTPGGIVYVLDMMTGDSHVNPPFSAVFAVNMTLTKEHGWVFSDAELERWMMEAGFQSFSGPPLPPPNSRQPSRQNANRRAN